MPKCNCCHETKPETDFPISTNYTKKDGTQSITRRKTCKPCYAGRNRERQQNTSREEFKRLVGWPATMLAVFATVTAIYSHDYISQSNRTCVYKSIYGFHHVTIDAMKMCPLTWEFERDE